MVTTGGALAFANFTPPYDATLTKNLREAGAVIIAKTVLTELANWVAGAPTPMPGNYSAVGGFAFNPYDPRPDPRESSDGRPVLSTGGSSSGAGTAANVWAANVGTDTAGSVVNPAALTMLVGIRPTTGRISRYGIMRTVAIDARLPALAAEEAKQKQCDNLVIATLNRKHDGGSGLGKALGQAAGTAAWYVPYGGSTGAYVARGVTVATAQAVSSVAATTRAKDELKLDYRVVTTANAVRVPAASDKLKAKTDGEDILTPLVEKAAQTIATGLMNK